jgi:N-acetylglucosaminyldiphosphoundecaprenol N-acetyl-beta-D-mannosaminyltransferase
VAAYTKEHYPGVRIAGYHNGFFSSDDEERIADEIRSSQADILFVALPTPRKENFLRRWRQHMGVSVCHGVGGSFDVMAGLTKRAPGWMQKCGMEWFYRLVQEPSRMWKRYLVTNTTFVWLSIVEIVRHRLHLQSKSSEEVVGQ